MIKLNFSPVRADEKTQASIDGTVLTVNGEAFDLSDIPDGATVNHPVIQNATRNGDDYELTITLTHGANAPHGTRFPEPVEVYCDWELMDGADGLQMPDNYDWELNYQYDGGDTYELMA